jgi:hypothetical protein
MQLNRCNRKVLLLPLPVAAAADVAVMVINADSFYNCDLMRVDDDD